jgi:superfamily II DNA/RNA helicase
VTTPTLAAPIPAPAPGFGDLGVPNALVTALAERCITEAFPIQTATLPDSLAGRDVLGRGRTGSGKTLAFALPLVVALMGAREARTPKRPRALVLVPTRELAAQVADVLAPLASAVGLRITTIYGGVGQVPQVKALRDGVDVVVACPGRLEDLIGQGHCRLDHVGVTVLDEADHMADLGFLPAVRRLLDLTPRGGQRLLFSATLDNGVDVLVKRYLVDPVTHAVDTLASPVPEMVHHVLAVSASDKSEVVRELARGEGRSLLFTRTKHGAKKLASQLTKSGVPAVELHGNLSQAARSRNLAAFTDGRARVLVATDIAARGIHVDEINLVVHVDPPAEHKAYLHRSGRTARAGAEGVVATLMTPDQRRDVQLLARDAGIRPTTTQVTPGHPLLADLAGPLAELRELVLEPAPQAVTARRPSGDRPAGGARRRDAGRSATSGQGQGRGGGSGEGPGARPRGAKGTGRGPAGSTGRARRRPRPAAR